MKYAYFQNSIFIILTQISPLYVCSLYIQMFTSHHVKEIKIHTLMHGIVSLVFPEVFNLKCTKYLKLKLQFSCKIYSYNV